LSISLILLCSDEELQELALAYFIIENDRYDLLLESAPSYMTFLINKDLTLRSLLGDAKFKQLIL